MNAIPYTHARNHLAETMEKVCDDHAPVIITRKSRGSVVMMSSKTTRPLRKPPTFFGVRGTHAASPSPSPS